LHKENIKNVASFCSVADLLMGQSPPGETYNNNGKGYPLLNGPTEFGLDHPTACLWTTAPTKICEKGDLLFCVRGTTTGRMNWADQAYCIGRGLCAIRAKTGFLDTNYIYYTLIDELSRLLSLCSGSVFLNLSRTDLEQFEIRWPPDSQERAKNASVLKGIDDKIKLNQSINKTLEALGQTIFKRWFVDFEFPNQEGKPYKTAGGKMTNSELGQIPADWSFGKFSDLVEVITGKGLCKDHLIEEGEFPVLGANGELGRTNDFLFNEKLILTGRVGTLGSVYLVGGKVWISDNVLISKPKFQENYHYSYFTLKSFDMDSLNRGSTQPLITQTDLKNQKIILPNKKTLESFELFAGSLFGKIEMNKVQNIFLSKIRDMLLPTLMSGKIRVPIINEEIGDR
jgi:type I restriction enzyme, S subunit